MCTTKGKANPKKTKEDITMSIKFFLNTDLFTEDYKATGINHAAYWAVDRRKKTGNKLLDFNDAIWDRDIPEIVDTLKRMGETEFTISSTYSSLVETLAGFDKLGVTISGMTEVNANTTAFNSNEFDRIPALLMKVN